MVQYTTRILKFGNMGEKTGWTYIEVPADLAQELMPGNKVSFRVKGKLDHHPIKGMALLPMGEGHFIMSLRADLRKRIGKKEGAMLEVRLEVDTTPQVLDTDFMECLDMEEKGVKFFKSLPKSHQHYFSKWITSAKTEETKAKRIAKAVNALARNMDFGAMMREKI